MEETKKTVYVIANGSSDDFRRNFGLLAAHGFVYRSKRMRDAYVIVNTIRYASQMVIFAHPDCKFTVLSRAGDDVRLSQFNAIYITAEEFIAKGLHKF